MSLYIAANAGEIASKVLLTDDPMRVKMIAADYLENARCHNEIRSMFGYTGTYKGKQISVQSSGIGAPSISVYAQELMKEYGVKSIIYVGSCTSVSENLKNRDIILAMSACTDSAMARFRFGDIVYSATADFSLLNAAYQKSVELGITAQVIRLFSTDMPYGDKTIETLKLLSPYGINAFDMETCELYILAAKYDARAVSILTVGDEILTGRQTGSAERQSTFHDMIKLAFETL